MSKVDKLLSFSYENFIPSRAVFRARFFSKVAALTAEQFLELVGSDLHLLHFAAFVRPSTTRWAASLQARDYFRKPFRYRGHIIIHIRDTWSNDLLRFKQVMLKRANLIWLGLADAMYYRHYQQFQQQQLTIMYLRKRLPVYIDRERPYFDKTLSTNYQYKEIKSKRKLTRQLTFSDDIMKYECTVDKLRKQIVIPWKYARFFELLSLFLHENLIKLCIHYVLPTSYDPYLCNFF
jgi:hypothetical protein